MGRFGWFLAVPFVMVGCSKDEVNLTDGAEETDDVVTAEPDIVVAPTAIDFDPTPVGGTSVRYFEIVNQGDADLEVSSIALTDSAGSSYTILTDVSDSRTVVPGGGLIIDVAFEPAGIGIPYDGSIEVRSDDADEPVIDVILSGMETYPELTVTPASLDFGLEYVPCGDHQTVTYENVGLESLTIDSSLVTGSDQFRLVDYNEYPLVLGPGETAEVDVYFDSDTPLGVQEAILTVESDSFSGPATVTNTGESAFIDTQNELVLVELEPQVDVLFAVDQSCSMDSFQADLAANFDSFINEIDQVTSGWRIGVATADSGCFNSGFLESTTPNYQALFANAVAQGAQGATGYSFTEALFPVVGNALYETRRGGCNDGFLRAGARLSIIFVSDEREQSNATVTPADWLVDYQAYSSDLVVSGLLDVNATCGAAAGDAGPGRYQDLVGLTNGLTFEVCSSDWTNHVDALAEASTAGLGTYTTAQVAHPGSITIYVDGVLFTDWTYDYASSTVIFTVEPPPNASIVVDYGVSHTCTP